MRGDTTMLPHISIIDIIQLERKKFSIETENKSCYVITCRIKGESLFFYDNKDALVKRGEVLYIPTGSNYSQKCESETIVCFHIKVSGKISSKIQVFSPGDTQQICDLFLKAVQLWKQKGQNYELLCMSILYEILSFTTIFEEENHNEDILTPAINYMDRFAYNTDFSFEQVCKNSYISRTHFNKLFFQAYKCTPSSYISKKRIERAKQFLINGSFSNEEIAHLCGFNDVKYFYTVFKRVTGFTTKEYKNQEIQQQHCAERKCEL